MKLLDAIEVEILPKHKSTALFRIENRLNEPNSLDLLTRLQTLLKKGYKDFIFDLSATRTISSSGLGVISYCQREVGFSKGRLVVICQDKTVLKLFELTQLDQFIRFSGSRGEAFEILAEK